MNNKELKAGAKVPTSEYADVPTSSQTIAKPNVSSSLLSYDVSRFIEWISINDEWRWVAYEGLWFSEDRSRTTQQLFDYYIKLPSNCR